jgi:hypothetical protein
MQVLLAMMLVLGAETDSVPRIHAVRTATPPRIDGLIDQVWAEGDSAKHFIQNAPKPGEPASDSTTVYVLYDAASLYVCFKCYANPDELVLRVAPRENNGGDNVGLLLDTYDDRQSGYYLAVNATGVEYDSRVSQDGDNWDDSWDGVWYSAARVLPWGYCVEMKIPFKSVRYGTGLTEWGINFDRSIPKQDEASYWAPQEASSWKVSRAGKLLDIAPHSQGANLEIYPVGLLRFEQAPAEDSGIASKFVPDGGLDVAWFPSPSTSIQATVNPDFAQIEADPTQINLGRYETWYSERRPFFIEGSDMFTTDVGLFYSRRIGRGLPDGTRVPILGGLKFAGRFDRIEVAGLEALCAETPYAWGTEPQSYFTVARFRLTDTARRSIGLLYAGKDNSEMSNRTIGLDANWRYDEFTFSGQLAPAWYDAPGVSKYGLAGSGGLNWNNPNYSASAHYSNTERDFDVSGVGYAPYLQERFLTTFSRRWRNLGPLRRISVGGVGTCVRNNEDIAHSFYDLGGTISGSAVFTNNWCMGGFVHRAWQHDYVFDPPYLDSTCYYASNSYWLFGETDETKSMSAELSGSYSPVGYNYMRHYFAPSAYLNATLSWRPNPSIRFDADITNVVEFDTLNRVEQMNWVIDPALNYAITRDLQVRLSGEAVPAYQFARLNVLLSWNLSPKSWFYVAWNESHSLETGLPLAERIGVLKLRYLFYF